jgi:polyhydroxybutyrate depolymerase
MPVRLVSSRSLLVLVALVACNTGGSDSATDGGSTDSTGSTTTAGTTTDADPTTTASTSAATQPTTGATITATGTTADSTTDGTTDATTDPTTDTGTTTGDTVASPGCGAAPPDQAGGVNVMIDAGAEGDGLRRFYLSRSPDYDPNVPHKLIFGFPGTNWVGEMIAPYFGLESDAVEPMPDEIFVYPDPLWRDFEGWGNLGGWVLGPHAAPADGNGDLVFVEAVIDYMENNYCIDGERVFATGHSWGGDMAQVVSCFLADRFRATVPVAANSPYWFDDNGQPVDCPGDTAVWTMFGQADDHFNSQDPGLQCRDFWLADRGCTGADDFIALDLGDAPDECVEYQGCSAPTRFCLYGAQYAHQIPSDYFAAATMAFFRGF